jgi:hypothetical protein
LLDASAHIEQAKSNEQISDFLSDTAYQDWRATCLFYAALHYIQAYFVEYRKVKAVHNHLERDRLIQSDIRIRAIWPDYRNLKDWSTRTRYDGVKPSAKDFKTEISPSLASLKKHLRAYVKTL